MTGLLVAMLLALAQDTCQDELAPECAQLCDFLYQGGDYAYSPPTLPNDARIEGWLLGTLDANDCTMDLRCFHNDGPTCADAMFRISEYAYAHHACGLLRPWLCVRGRASCMMDNAEAWVRDNGIPCVP